VQYVLYPETFIRWLEVQQRISKQVQGVPNLLIHTVQIYQASSLWGLSHEIDFKNLTKFTELGLSKGCGWF
jgi:hypothetical protein